jgi:hypothetical protein
MKRFFMLLTLAAFIIAAPMAMAAEQSATPKMGSMDKPGVTCCVKGQCTKAASASACTQEGGKVVKDCKHCK